MLLSFAFSGWAVGFEAEAFDYNREMLQPLTKYRQQHRRTVDGRLCAAAFVQNRKAYTGCTDAANPVGESGRSWCYVEPQLLDGRSLPWNYCVPVVSYESLRTSAKTSFAEQAGVARMYVGKLQTAQRAAEKALDMFQKKCGGV